MITAFPKIFAIGTDYINDIFKENVQITEKIDGSQLDFGKVNGELYIRSKGAQLYFENPEKMFLEGISYIEQIGHIIPDNTIFYAEYLKTPKHNTLNYSRVPKNRIMLFGVKDTSEKFFLDTEEYAELLGIEHVPILYYGKVNDVNELTSFLERESILGNATIEGVVVKNFERKFLLGGMPMPIMAGKYVSEKFKEVHRERWGIEEKAKSRMAIFCESFRTEARWEKAVQHLVENGELENEPKDIGKLFKEVHEDIEQEEKENIKNFLWGQFKNEIKKKATHGMPEWYKKKLA